ncbi:UDP-glucuronosyltransferase [Lunatimonas salinarum]|uniref:UDP-glucuronosyltransferase n=1 Tax=Lunatimonas salinarum TaxID=1774590 RepID=UPI001ADFA3E3|nr:UDP-glucuronosyltransferase [Lunatimonas salinarum]
MVDFDFTPESYFDGTGPSALIVKLTYPESTWGEEISLYATTIDGIIYFEAIDFYGNEFSLTPDHSQKPLSLQELIVLIERLEVQPGAGLGNVDLTLSGIPIAKSNLYPQLEAFFAEKRKHFGYL